MVAAIIAWNAPLVLMTIKLAPALLAGCTVILKASPEAPIEAHLMAEIVQVAGLPAGVFNVVTAHREVSEGLVRHPGVDKVSFTGSTAAWQAHCLDLRRTDRACHRRTWRQVARAYLG